MRVLVTGGNGQLGRMLARTAPAGAELLSVDVDSMDLTDAAAVREGVTGFRPELIINGAAFTAVDKAESAEAAARAVNAGAVATMAEAARDVGARLVQISTDFVFDGQATRPYRPEDAPRPLSVYGQTKLEGERAAGPEALIVRTAWVYEVGGANFVATMLRLMADRDEIAVVADQFGTPTRALSLAEALWELVRVGASGIHHYTDAGVASWYDFAVAIREEGEAAGLLAPTAARVRPIATAEYPTPAARPCYGIMDKSATWGLMGRVPPHWRVNLRAMLKEMAGRG